MKRPFTLISVWLPIAPVPATGVTGTPALPRPGRPAIGCLAILLALAPIAVPAGESPDLELLPAWNGLLRSDAVTEIGVRLMANRRGELTVTVATAATRVRTRALVEPDVPLILRLPIRANATDIPVLDLEFAGAPPQRRELRELQPHSLPLVALASVREIPMPEPDGDYHLFRPPPAAFPHDAQAYETIAALVLDLDVLIRFEDAQLEALQRYLNRCGRLVLVVASSPIPFPPAVAGCDGRFIRIVTDPAHIATVLTELLREHPPALPDATALSALLPAGSAAPRLTGGFLLAYALLLLVLAWRIRRPIWLLAMPLGGTAVALALWSRPVIDSRVITWAEMSAGSTAARHATLVQVNDYGRGETALTLPRALGLPHATPSDPPVELHRDSRRPDLASLQLHTRLLDRQELSMTGELNLSAPLRLQLTTAGPWVENPGPETSRSGWLIWEGSRYTLPELPPGRRWTPPPQAEAWGDTPVEQLFRRQSVRDPAAVLLPFSLRDAGLLADTSQAEGWLLLHPAPAAESAL